MANITDEQVLRMAELIRLEVKEDEVEGYKAYMNKMLTYAEGLNDVDTTGIEPTISVVGLENVFRKDEPKRTVTREEALNNSPDQADGQFRVPSILE